MVWRGKPTYESFYPLPLAGGVAVFCSALGFMALPAGWAAMLLLASAAFCAGMCFFAGVLANSYSFVLTDQRVRGEFRLWVVRVWEVPVDKITDAVVVQGLVGRVLRFGHVRVDAAGTLFPGLLIRGVRDPLEVCELVHRVRRGGRR